MNSFQSIIFKSDDLGLPTGIENFKYFDRFLAKYHIPVSIGIIAKYLKFIKTSDIDYIKGMLSQPGYEIWNHSFKHPKLPTLSKSEQYTEIKNAQNEIARLLGLQPEFFGAPYNLYDANSIEVIGELGFKGVYLVEEALMRGSSLVNIDRGTLLSPEFVRSTNRECDFIEFKRRFHLKKNQEYLVVQFHPPAWNQVDFIEFERIINFLIEQRCRFINFNDYVNLQNRKLETPSSKSIEYDKIAIATCNSLRDSLIGKSFSDYFFTRYKLGTQRIINTFKSIGFDNRIYLDNDSANKHSILDIGAGTGEWALAYSMLHPDANLILLDKTISCCDISRTIFEKIPREFNYQIVNTDVSEIHNLYDKNIVRCWSINSLQYMDIDIFLKNVRSALIYGGEIYFSTYSLGAPLGSLSSALDGGDMKSALEIINAVLKNIAYELGWFSMATSTRYYRSENIINLLKNRGFDVVRSRLDVEQYVGSFHDSPILMGFLASKNSSDPYEAVLNSFLSATEAERLKLVFRLVKMGGVDLIQYIFINSASLDLSLVKQINAILRLKENKVELLSTDDFDPKVKTLILLAQGKLAQALDSIDVGSGDVDDPVSYTHLTLPTIYSV